MSHPPPVGATHASPACLNKLKTNVKCSNAPCRVSRRHHCPNCPTMHILSNNTPYPLSHDHSCAPLGRGEDGGCPPTQGRRAPRLPPAKTPTRLRRYHCPTSANAGRRPDPVYLARGRTLVSPTLDAPADYVGWGRRHHQPPSPDGRTQFVPHHRPNQTKKIIRGNSC